MRRGVSHAQLKQDLYVLYKLDNKKNGYFVEFGATNGKQISNTYLLEKAFGWTGIVAEPSPFWHAELRRNRNCIIETKCVWKRSGEHLQFLVSQSSPELATIESFRNNDHHKEFRAQNATLFDVETISLNELLSTHSAPRIIDYLSVDTEGSELDILEAFDFTKHTPRILSVEHNHIQTQREQLRELLEARGYVREFAFLSDFDDWYYHPDLVS